MFKVGNVILTKEGSIEIVIQVRPTTELVTTIPYDYENCEITHRYKTYTEEYHCDCGECEDCLNYRSAIRTVYGMEDARLLAHSVKDWIVSSALSALKGMEK